MSTASHEQLEHFAPTEWIGNGTYSSEPDTYAIYDDAGKFVCRLDYPFADFCQSKPSDAAREANARAIVAVPKMLRALRVIGMSPGSRAWLAENDPQALAQVLSAIKAATIGDPPDENRCEHYPQAIGQVHQDDAEALRRAMSVRFGISPGLPPADVPGLNTVTINGSIGRGRAQRFAMFVDGFNHARGRNIPASPKCLE